MIVKNEETFNKILAIPRHAVTLEAPFPLRKITVQEDKETRERENLPEVSNDIELVRTAYIDVEVVKSKKDWRKFHNHDQNKFIHLSDIPPRIKNDQLLEIFSAYGIVQLALNRKSEILQ